jgi:putative membrane protein (TIGR04086 family)
MRKQVVNLKGHLSHMHWDLVVKAAVLIYIATFILGVALTFPVLAFLNWVLLTPERAAQTASLITAFLVIVVTGYGALRVAHRVERAAVLHGFLVGLLVALISLLLDVLFIRASALVGLSLYILMVAAGWLGGQSGALLARVVLP